MKIKLGRMIPFVKLEVNFHEHGTQCEIGINKTIMDDLSKEDQDRVTNELEQAFRNITRIIEEQK